MPDPSVVTSSSTYCPQCQHALLRVPRYAADRSDHPGLRRFRCGAKACAWEGLLPRRSHAGPQARSDRGSGRSGHTRRRRGLALLPLALGSVAAMAGLPLLVLLAIGLVPAWLLGPEAGLKDWRSLPIGHSDDGVPVQLALAQQQPAEQQPAEAPLNQQSPTTADARLPPAAAATPLELRHGCAWGQPGRNPYRGTTEQALTAAGLPPEVVQRVSMMRAAGAVTDRLQISRHQIRSVGGGREFNPQSFVMSFGHTVCRSSRVNFALGHVEAADLYEVRDNKGRRHAVMVPDVCGNVSVLGNRAERGLASKLAQALAERGLSSGWLDAVLEDGMLVTAPADADGPFSAPEPGTLASVLLALGLLGVLQRRRGRRAGGIPGG